MAAPPLYHRGMANPIPCRMLQPTDRFRRSLRRFSFGQDCGTKMWGHNAVAQIDIIELPGYEWAGRGILPGMEGSPEKDDVRWPTVCSACGYQFTPDDQWQVNDERMYSDGSGEWTHREAPAGCMWFAPWYDGSFKPQLAHCLVVVLPGGHDWVVDSQANNCTIPDDRAQEQHHCWVIEGELPNITVGKGGPTCAAGAGSIQTGSWHGFLRNGALVEC